MPIDRIARTARRHPGARAGWRDALREGLISGAAASVLSTLVLMRQGRTQAGSWAAPTNATSHWIWGDPALRADEVSWRHTFNGYAIHHAAAFFWATLHARSTATLSPRRDAAAIAAAGMATAAVACVADYTLTPRRLTPGFEHRLSTGAMAMAYGAFGLGIALASLAWRARRGQ
ncbi:hypothetical protein [Bordetella genomosp. 13]|uniref:hypothetical protein n=1 Tax=Bordetella genomosp. 13 TaxID=463040 RepID=UPI0011A35BFD|nr:hypothetical protein [Bordetella genomosp. 13]